MSRTELSKTQLFPVLLRAASLSNLDNTVINNSISNTKYAEFCTKQQVLLHFHSPNYAYNYLYNLDQKTVPLLQSIFTSLFHPDLVSKSYLQFPLTLPSSIPQQFCTSLFLRTTIPTIFTKNIFPISAIQPIQTVPREQGARDFFAE